MACEFTALKSLSAISTCQKGCSWLQLQVELFLEFELSCTSDSKDFRNTPGLGGRGGIGGIIIQEKKSKTLIIPYILLCHRFSKHRRIKIIVPFISTTHYSIQGTLRSIISFDSYNNPMSRQIFLLLFRDVERVG